MLSMVSYAVENLIYIYFNAESLPKDTLKKKSLGGRVLETRALAPLARSL